MKDTTITFLGYQINYLSYEIKDLPKESLSNMSKFSEEITTSLSEIESHVSDDFTEAFVKCNVHVNTSAVMEKQKNDFRELKFQYICRFKIDGNATQMEQINTLLDNGGMNIALTHIRDIIKDITSIDDRGPIRTLDRSFPDDKLKRK